LMSRTNCWLSCNNDKDSLRLEEYAGIRIIRAVEFLRRS